MTTAVQPNQAAPAIRLEPLHQFLRKPIPLNSNRVSGKPGPSDKPWVWKPKFLIETWRTLSIQPRYH
jgi:hypothetical protein